MMIVDEDSFATAVHHCAQCGDTLTNEERFYYESRCSWCEGEWAGAIAAWRAGAANPQFDAMYAGPQRVLQ